jgi:chemotaxis protein methyltransferase CheR
MTRAAEVEFLQWALPRLGLRWAGFRRVRAQVCRRVRRRLVALGLDDLAAYRAYLDAHPEEWDVLDALTPITISRFYRDREVFARLEREVVPALAAAALAADRGSVRCWSAGCASGEEAYTLALMGGGRFDILATDIDVTMLDRARTAAYPASSLKELPVARRERGFVRNGELYVLRPEQRRLVTLRRHDVCTPPPDGRFDLVLCSNVAFTYLAAERQHAVLAHLATAVHPGDALVVGLHEALPQSAPEFKPWPRTRAVFRRTPE